MKTEHAKSLSEQTLLRISIVSALLGLIVLFAISRTIAVNDTTIEKITGEKIGDTISLTGRLTSIEVKESLHILTVEQPQTITVVAFGDMDARVGETVQVKGTVSEYDGETQIVADEIKRI